MAHIGSASSIGSVRWYCYGYPQGPKRLLPLHCNKKDQPPAISQFRCDRAYFGRGSREEEKVGNLDESTRAIFGRSYAAETNVLIEQLRKDGAIAEADTLLPTLSNPPGVAYNVHVIEAILTTVAPALRWR